MYARGIGGNGIDVAVQSSQFSNCRAQLDGGAAFFQGYAVLGSACTCKCGGSTEAESSEGGLLALAGWTAW